MKRGLVTGITLLAAAALQGCPIFPDDSGCVTNADCASGYQCDLASGACVSSEDVGCSEPSDCGPNETCGQDRACHIGSCHFADIGCVAGHTCTLDDGTWACVPGDAGGQPSAGAGGQLGVAGATASGGAGGTVAAGGSAAGGVGQGGAITAGGQGGGAGVPSGAGAGGANP